MAPVFSLIRPYLYRVKLGVFAVGCFLARLAALPLVLPALALLYALEPFRRVRICHLGSLAGNFGALVISPDYYLRRWAREGKPERILFLFVMHSPTNRPLMEMYKRVVTVTESRLLDMLLTAATPLLKKTRFLVRDHGEYHNSKFFSGGEVFLHFTSEEERRGRALLESIGIGEKDWFICFHAREPEFYQDIGLSDFTRKTHAYRNCRPENYLAAARIVADLGGFAIRMGAGVSTPLPKPLPARIIDYAANRHDPFADIYLCAKARFFLGNTSGLFTVPTIFGVPGALANYIPYQSTPYHPSDLWIPKHIRHIPSGHLLTFQEVEDIGLLANALTSPVLCEILERENLVCEENTPEEIVDLCLDMLDVLEGRPASPEARELQLYFRQRYHANLRDIEHLPLIGARFALQHKALILDQRTPEA